MRICFRFSTNGWYCVTKGKIRWFVFGFCWRASFLSLKFTSERVVLIRSSGQPLCSRCALKFVIFSSNISLEEFVLRSRRASPLMKPFLTPCGWRKQNGYTEMSQLVWNDYAHQGLRLLRIFPLCRCRCPGMLFPYRKFQPLWGRRFFSQYC